VFEIVALYIVLINLSAFGAFWFDKRAAEGGRYRVPERSLLMLAVVGGTSGAIAAQQLFRHKTRKEPFRSILWLIAAVQVLLLALLYARAAAER
jgi:uncharacterized membrane protein YsdA (DUF1294 family)